MRNITFFLPLILISWVAGIAQEQTPSFTLAVQGTYTWSFALGIGDRAALQRAGLSPWIPSLRQSFTASIEGKALEVITVRAKLDSSRGVAFQDFGVYLDAARWRGVLGNFSLGNEYAFAVPRRSLLGAKIAYLGDGFTVEGLASRSLGKLKVRVFRGERGHAETEFFLRDPRAPWAEAPYRVNLEGLYYFELIGPYVEGFTEVKLSLAVSETLLSFLRQYGLDYLGEILKDEPEREFEFSVIRDSGIDILLLLNSPRENVKRWIEDAIRAYNDRHNLTGTDEKRYPFVSGSELEREFLDKLIEFVSISVNGEEHPLDSGKRRRYLNLAEKEIVSETLSVEIRGPGEKEYKPLTPGGEFSFRLFPDVGILRIDFPDRFFEDDAALRLSFDYVARRGIFILSPLAGIVPNSERVYRDGKRLLRGQHYNVDYEGGILQLFSPLKEGEELRVEYEVPYGLGTGPQEDFLGLSLSLGKGIQLFVFRSAESVELTPTTPTMPNDHTVAGLMFSGGGESWDYSLILGGSVNIFPPGKNERIPGPNRITAIASVSAPDGGYIVFSHYRGISVFKDGIFNSYRTGRGVYDLLHIPGEEVLLLAEQGSVVILDLSRSFPFDWRESYTKLILYQEGFGGEGGGTRLGREALALAADLDWVYVATDRGIIRFPKVDLRTIPEIVSDEDAWESWRTKYWGLWARLPVEGESPTALLATEEALYLGTDSGLYVHTGNSWIPVLGAKGPIHDLVYLTVDLPGYPSGLYAATGDGVVRIRNYTVEESVITGTEVLSLAFYGEKLFYGTGKGLFESDMGPLYGIEVPVTSLECSLSTLWVGSEAISEQGQKPDALSLWAVDPVAETVVEYPETANRILPTDPGHYRDISPEGNTDRGLLAQFTWNEKLQRGSLSWYVRTSTPDYEPIDRPPPGDTHAVGFNFSREEGALSLNLTGSVGVQRLFSRPISNVQGGISLAWSPGPQIFLNFSPRFQGLGTENRLAEADYSLGLSWKRLGNETSNGLLKDISMRLLGGIRGGTKGSGGTAEIRAILGPFWGFTLSLSGRRPYLLDGVPMGRESLSGVLTGELSLLGIRGRFAWKETWGHDLGPYVADVWRFTREVSFAPKFEAISFGEWSLRTNLTLGWHEDSSETQFSLKSSLSLDSSAGEASTQLILGLDLGYRSIHRTGDAAYSLTVNPRLSYNMASFVRVELSSSLSYKLFLRQIPRESVKPRVLLKNLSLNFIPLWWEQLEPRFVLSYSPGRLEFSLQRTQVEFHGLSVEVSSRLTWNLETGNLEGEIKAVSASLPLAKDWSLNLEGGCLIRLRSGKELKHGLYLRGNLALNFSL